MSVLGMLTICLLFGATPAGTDTATAAGSGFVLVPPGSGPSPAKEQFELRSAIAFVSSRDNPPPPGADRGHVSEIYLMLMKPDGTRDANEPLRRLTDNTAGDGFAALSPDGKKVVFDSNRDRKADEPANTSDLFLMDADGSGQIKLPRGSSATWSPDSKWIAFHASASGTGTPIRGDAGAPTTDSDIFVMNVDDCLSNLDACRTKQAAPGVLPAFLKNITHSGADIDDDANWSPVGQELVFTSHPVTDSATTSVHAEVYTIDLATGQRTCLTCQCPICTNGPEEERDPAWSPDGTHISYACKAGGTIFQVCVMDANGAGQKALTHLAVPAFGSNWSPDGAFIVFHRAVSGRIQLFIMKADGTGLTQLTTPPDFPALSDNGFANWGVVRVKS
jgi:Tol biopolymer transport system component